MGDLQKTSIHIIPVKGGSEAHNLRTKELSYVKKELTPLNGKISHDTISNRLKTIKEKYTATTGQKMQKKATPIREGVIVIDKHTKLHHLENLAIGLKSRFGIDAFQIYLHADEGHNDLATGEWKSNLHAHMVFDWTDKTTGKSIRLNRQDMSEMQTMCAELLDMERGVSSEKKHLNAVQWKALKTQEELAKGTAALEHLKIENEKIKPKENVSKAISKTAEIALEFLGKSKADKEKDALKTENIAWEEKYKALEKELGEKLRYSNSELEKERWENRTLRSEKEENKGKMEKYKSLIKDVVKLADILPQNMIDSFRTLLPNLYKEGAYAQQFQRRDKNTQQGYEM